jgi:ABC-type multidrug transport system ATPase subunit
MDEAMQCDRVALMQEGQLMLVDQPRKIRNSFSRKLFSVKAAEKFQLITALRNYPGTLTAYPFGDSVHLTMKTDSEKDLLKHLNSMGIPDASVDEIEASIEDRFLELMQKE